MNRDDAIDLDLDVSVDINNNIISQSEDDGIEIRLHPYNGKELVTSIKYNFFTENKANGIQFIDYEFYTDRSFTLTENTFVKSGYSEISYSDNEITLPSFDIGSIAIPITISKNTFFPSEYSFTGSGGGTIFINNLIYSLSGDGKINTTNDFSAGENMFIQLHRFRKTP